MVTTINYHVVVLMSTDPIGGAREYRPYRRGTICIRVRLIMIIRRTEGAEEQGVSDPGDLSLVVS